MKIIHERGSVYALEYHIVWCTKYRRQVLTGDVEERLHVVLDKCARENGFSIEESDTDKDHVHLLISTTPHVYLPDIIKAMKGSSARDLLKHYPRLKDKLWEGHLWSPSYYIGTANDEMEQQIKDYVQDQKVK